MAVIGTAGWVIPSVLAAAFPGEPSSRGTHLARYANVFAGVEINSSFHRPHRPATYARWADAVPPEFGFSVKLPKTITHRLRLADTEASLEAFLGEVAGLGEKLAVLLVQLPPSFAFDAMLVDGFFKMLRQRTAVAIACEPRHPSWFTREADACLAAHRIARVAAHPVLADGGEMPGGWTGLNYHRLHGAPRVYHSAYDGAFLEKLAQQLRGAAAPAWCVFDNTASGAATANALALRAALSR